MRPTGLIRVGLLALIWGSGFLWIKLSLRGFSPVQLTFVRLALGAAVLLVVLWRSGQSLPNGGWVWRHLAVAAVLGNAVPYLLFGIAERSVTSNLAGAINATTPLWTVIFTLATGTEHELDWPRVFGLGLGFTGALVMLAPWQASDATVGGALACLAASASYGASYVYIGRHLTGGGVGEGGREGGDRELSPVVLSAGQLVCGAGLLVVAAPFGGFTGPRWRIDAVVGLIVLGVIGTGLAYLINYRIMVDDGPVLASTVTYLLPIVAVVLGAVVLDESITPRVVAGVLIVLAGVALTRHAPKPAVPA